MLKQPVKITISWDAGGCILSMEWNCELDLPTHGKKFPMRREIFNRIMSMVKLSEEDCDAGAEFRKIALSTFTPCKIKELKSVTKGSTVHLKGDEIATFIRKYKDICAM